MHPANQPCKKVDLPGQNQNNILQGYQGAWKHTFKAGTEIMPFLIAIAYATLCLLPGKIAVAVISWAAVTFGMTLISFGLKGVYVQLTVMLTCMPLSKSVLLLQQRDQVSQIVSGTSTSSTSHL